MSDFAAHLIEEGLAPVTVRDVPDALWATDNDFHIPVLDPTMQARQIDLPVSGWGARSRKLKLRGGAWHFYVSDYRFTALWRDPSPLLNTGAMSAVEPNFSCYDQTPVAVAMWRIYQKRWIARYWQSRGIAILVDLNVSRGHANLNLIGVPQGWRSYATRGYSERLDGLEFEFELARVHAGSDSLVFLVVGGGQAVKQWCQDHGRYGVIWVPEVMDVAHARPITKGYDGHVIA